MPILKEEGQPLASAPLQKTVKELLSENQLIADNSSDAIIGEMLDGTITSWNNGATKMFGYSAEEMIGQSVLLLLPPELRDDVSAILNRIKAGEIIPDYDSVRICKDGSKIDVSISGAPIRMLDGTVIGASIVERNITSRKKTEELLRQTQLIVDNSHDAIIGETLDGIVTSWNNGAVRMFGYSAQEVVGKSVLFLLPKEMQSEVPLLLGKIKAGEVIEDYDSIRICKDNSLVDVAISGAPIRAKYDPKISVAVSVSPVKKEDGTVIGASIVERDITKRKKAERHLAELNETYNQFITIISHQLRTPLTAINWNLESLLNGDFGKLEDTQSQFLRATHEASLNITERINDLLTAMDIEEGRLVVEKKEMALDSICLAVIEKMKKHCELKKISLNYNTPDKALPAMSGDGAKLRTVIVKLIENAISYTKADGQINVTLSQVGDQLRFEVKDSGIGIPAVEQEHIFARFFRATNASSMQTDAFGLGLFTAKNFIEQHGGKISFASKEGVGSTFWFEIPLKV